MLALRHGRHRRHGAWPRARPSLGRQRVSPAQLLAQLAAYHADGGARPGVLEVRLQREEMPPFAPFLPEDAETYVAAWNVVTVSSAA